MDLKLLRQEAQQKWSLAESDLISLSTGEIDFPLSDEMKQAIKAALDKGKTFYGHEPGDKDLLEIIRAKLSAKNRLNVSPNDIYVIPGTMFGIFLACWVSLKPKEEAVIAPGPAYGPFFENVTHIGAKAVFNDLKEPNYRINLDDLKKKITRRTRLLMLCNPHNPTGRVFTREELEGIAFLAKKYDLTVFSDELYEDLVYEGEHISIASLNEDMARRTLTVFGFSKAFSAGGLRVAYCVNQGEIMNVLRTRLPLMIGNTDRLVQAAAKEALTGARGWLCELKTHLCSMRDYSMQRMNALEQFELMRPEAGFYLFPRMISKRMNSTEMARFLRQKARVAVVPGIRFGQGGEGHIRINFGTSKKILIEAFDRIERTLSSSP